MPFFICNEEDTFVKIGNECLSAEEHVDLLGIKIDRTLNFSCHVSNLCNKASQKLHALARIGKFLTEDKLKLLMRAFVTSQFNYCPLAWMCHTRTLNNRINNLHERALRIAYKEEKLTFEELLEKDDSITIHERNLQRLAIEMYKIKKQLCPLPFQELFTKVDHQYDLRNKRTWESQNIRTTKFGSETFTNLGPKIWNIIPNDIKASSSLLQFKAKIKSWKPVGCPCKLCKSFVPNLGYL